MTNSSSTSIRRYIVLVVLLGLFSWVFCDAIFRDGNFIYRDASQFYYPLLRVVQEEWKAGRWPLWNPQENAGMPLLGNPASAVLYPPRILFFQWLPLSYGTAYKWYILSHVLWCAATAWMLARHWKLSDWAAGVAGMTYAFSAAVMFQYCNVIFLVGASWVPLGLLAADRALGDADWRWAVALGLILAMQMFGGDPEAAYVTGGLAAIYLALIDVPFAVTLLAALPVSYLSRRILRQEAITGTRILDWLLVAIALLAFVMAPRIWARLRQVVDMRVAEPRDRVWRRRACLGTAAVVAAGVSAVQWIPSWEFGRISNRAAGGVHYEPYAFWIAPWRIAEFIWPNVMGREYPVHARWLDIFMVGDRLWEPSLYCGAFAMLLAVTAWGVRRVTHWQRWMSITLVLSLWAATGPAGGISWYRQAFQHSRLLLAGSSGSFTDAAGANTAPRRSPLELENPAGGLYWAMVEMLPGFDTFRYPAKLMTFAACAIALLAAAGWDRMVAGAGPPKLLIAMTTGTSLLLALVALITRPHLVGWFQKNWFTQGTAYYGPLVAPEAWRCIFWALITTPLVLGLAMALLQLAKRWANREWVYGVLLAIVAADLGVANRWMVVTAPQREIDGVPRLVEKLRDAEAAETGSGDRDAAPFRIHRISVWSPPRWAKETSTDRDKEIYYWEKHTIQPKHGMPYGVHYTINEGTLEPYDYWWFFAPFYSNVTERPRSIVYYPMRGFDMWGAKYFVLPQGLQDNDQNRGIRTFLSRSTLIAESPWDQEDYQLRRNLTVYPRAWIVHQVIHRSPIRGLSRADRMDRMREILYEGFDGLWRESHLDSHVQDPRRVAWIEDPDLERVMAYHDPAADLSADRCRIVRYESDRVEVEAESGGRGVLVLADLYYPGWEVTVDGKPTPMLRANRMMRGVPLEPGKHTVVFVFRPRSVRIGAAITLASLLATTLAAMVVGLRSRWTVPSPT